MRGFLLSMLAVGWVFAGCDDGTPSVKDAGKKDGGTDGAVKDVGQPPDPDGAGDPDGPLPSDAARADMVLPSDAARADMVPMSDAARADMAPMSDAARADMAPMSDAAAADLLPDAPHSDAALADMAPVDAVGDAPLSDAALADLLSDAAAADQNLMDQATILDIIGVNDISVTEAGVIIGTTACTDKVDNDGDGKIDHLDPECTGAADNDEATFGTGIPGDNMDCKQDCFFDGDSGGGGGDCVWQTGCDPLDTSKCKDFWTYPTGSDGGTTCPTASCPASYHCENNVCVSDKDCPSTQTTGCLASCELLSPNGCDCFGCCTFPLPGGGSVSVKLVATCNTSVLDDPVKCPRCTPTTSCDNPCGECELCVGKTTLPPSCYPDSGVPVGECPFNWQWCGDGTPCPVGTWCLTGCCAPAD